MTSGPGATMRFLRQYWLLIAVLAALVLLSSSTGLPLSVSLPISFTAALVVLVVVVASVGPALETRMSPPVRIENASTAFDQTEAVLDVLPMPVLIFDEREVISFQNQPARELFGPMEPGSHLSARLRAPQLLDMVRAAIRTRESGETDYLERVPTERRFHVHAAPFGADRFVLSFRDTSESAMIERMRTDFVANASHELRTPLASLRGFIETMQGPARNDQKAQERFLGIMLEQVNRMSRLVDDLLSLSRLELKAHVAPTGTVDLVPLVSHVRDSLLPLAEGLGVTLKLESDAPSVPVRGDRDALVQVFENLIENACKYGQEGERVEVSITGGADGPVTVTVTDHGPGIPREHIPRLTERFYRVNVEASRSKKGTGLGLAIVKHILTRHKARLSVRSEPGQGSSFTVHF